MKSSALLFLCSIAPVAAQTSKDVLVVINDSSLVSRRIGEYYVRKRSIPVANVCHLKVTADEDIARDVYEKSIEKPIAAYLKAGRLKERVLYIVTTLGVPLTIVGSLTGAELTEDSSVDSELTLLYSKMGGAKFKLTGMVPNPFFGRRDAEFRHPDFAIYLVTRLAGYDFDDVKGIIDRSLTAANRGKIVLDLNSSADGPGNDWLRATARMLPAERVVLDESDKVLYDEKDVIGYAGWGSNDKNRKRRFLGFQWLPGAVATEFVSTDGRTFQRPSDSWNITTWQDKEHYFAGTPQSLAADYIHEGATGCSGHVREPYLHATPRPDYLLPAYFHGRNLAESYYLAIVGLSWQNVVIGDPLCRIGKAP